MDEALEFGLPHTDERKKILDLYLDRCVTTGGENGECCRRLKRIQALNFSQDRPCGWFWGRTTE